MDLDIENCLKTETIENIDDLIMRMRYLLEYFSGHQKYISLSPFLKTYLVITETVNEKREDFNNPKALESLDIRFAALYFGPLKKFLFEGKASEPWKTYFEYCSLPKGTSFLQMLLGINSHINGDLSKAVLEEEYWEKEDFFKVNSILQEKIPDVMKYLAVNHKDIYGLGAAALKELTRDKFEKTIVQWRAMSWNNALKIKEDNFDYQAVLNKATESTALDLIQMFDDYKLHKLPIRLKEMEEIDINIKTA